MNHEGFLEMRKRKGERRAKLGRNLENDVEKVLEKMKEDGSIENFQYNPPNSPDDADGKDFTVTLRSENGNLTRSFGVTISPRSWNESKKRHPGTPQFCWPIGTNPETMRKRILELFS